MFQRFGGVAEHIRTRRLARARALLADRRRRRRISEIGHSCGFTNDATFSRAFRQHYGYTAREVQAFSGPALFLPAGAAAATTGNQADAVTWIRELAG